MNKDNINIKKGLFTKVVRLEEFYANGKIATIESTYIVRVVNYANTQVCKANGGIVKPTWFHHTNVFGVVEHNTNGRQYLQVMTTNNPHHKTKRKCFIGDTRVSYQELIDSGFIKAKKSQPTTTFVLPLEQIISIG